MNHCFSALAALLVTNVAFAQPANSTAPAGTVPTGNSSPTAAVAPTPPNAQSTNQPDPAGATAPVAATAAPTGDSGPASATYTSLPATAAPADTATPTEQQGPRPAPPGPLKIELPNATIKFGFLLQPQYEAVGSPALSKMTHNLFLRRTRILVGATLYKNFEFFFDSDFPNLFRAANNTAGEANTKATPGMNVQDAFGTVKAVGDSLKIDMGYMLPPLAHNALQGAVTLYSWDYFSNSFRHSNVFQSSADPIGRDAGVQLRGLVLDNIVEYRVGLFQGKRENVSATEVSGRNMFRVAGRLQINLFDPEPGFFYAGSYLGTKRILSFGVSYDFQDHYHHSSGDGILDMPLGPGVVTAQADVSHWNGGSWVILPRQTAFMSEAGYLINAINLSPILRFERRWVDNQTAAVPDETRFGGGVGFWPYGHNINLKGFYTRVIPTPAAHSYNQVNVQMQFYTF